MNEMGLKEKALIAVIGVIVLYAVAAATWFLVSEKSWDQAAKKYDRVVKRYEKEESLIAEKRKWNDAYEAEKAAMPMFEVEKATDTTWLRTVGEIASTNRVLITTIDVGKEVVAEDVLELPIEVKSVEGSLEAFVRFMHELENTDKGMFDIKSINLQPDTKKPGYLKGSLSLTCAYMREG